VAGKWQKKEFKMDKKVYFFSLMLMLVVSITMGRDALALPPEESGIVEREIISESLVGQVFINSCNGEEVTLDTGQIDCLMTEIERPQGAEKGFLKCSGEGTGTGDQGNAYTFRVMGNAFDQGVLRTLVKFMSPTAPNFYVVAVEVEMDGVERVDFVKEFCAPGGPVPQP
jgi:hypothetical protein